MASTIQVELGFVEVRNGSVVPVLSTKHSATPKTLTSSTTAEKPSIVANNAAFGTAAGYSQGSLTDRRQVWTVTNAGTTDIIYAIFGLLLTASDYTTANAADFGHMVLPGRSREFFVHDVGEEVVIIQAA